MSSVLVAYASKHGATARIAERIGEALRAEGHDAEVVAAGEVGALDSYEAVVLGSAVYTGRWRREALGLLKRLGHEPPGRPLWLFSSGPVGEETPDPDDRWQHPTKVREAGEALGALGQMVFGGRVPADPRGFMERAVVRNTPADQRDRLDLDEVARWARGIAARLRSGR